MNNRRRTPSVNGTLCFEVGRHRVCLEQRPEGWAVSVDGLALGTRFQAQAEAWLAGVQTARALDTPAPRLARPGGNAPRRPGDRPSSLGKLGTAHD